MRDRHTDVRAGKRTLAVRFGRRACELEAAFFYAVAYVVPIVLGVLRASPLPLLPLLTAPLALAAYDELRRHEGKALDATLGKTAKVLLAFGVPFALGLAWS